MGVQNGCCRRGFALAELVVVVGVVVVLTAALAVGVGETRRQAGLSDDLSSLKQFAGSGSAFAADNEDRVWTFWWEPNRFYTVVENGVTLMILSGPT